MHDQKVMAQGQRNMATRRSGSETLGIKSTALIKVTICFSILIITVFQRYMYSRLELFTANQGFLNMLKQKFMKSSSSKHVGYDSSTLPNPGKSRGRNKGGDNDEDNRNNTDDRLLPSATASGNLNATTATNSANVTPEMSRRKYVRDNDATAR